MTTVRSNPSATLVGRTDERRFRVKSIVTGEDEEEDEATNEGEEALIAEDEDEDAAAALIE